MAYSTDPVVLLLTERNLDLERIVRELRRDIEVKEKTIEDLKRGLSRPAIAVFTEGQLQNLAFLLAEMVAELISDGEVKKEFVN